MSRDGAGIGGIIKSLGLVFGDIGTSPIYTLTVIILLTKPTSENITGVLSLIVWTLCVLVTLEYGWLAMSLGKKGEGGTIVLKEILRPLLKSSRQVAFITLLSIIGISLLIGDGVITPAISILSAVEGLLLVPGLEKTGHNTLILIAGIIAVILFFFQDKGTERVAKAFGPIMLLWFIVLSVSGVLSIVKEPMVLKAVNPYYGVKFLIDNGVSGFFILSEVTLCATGGEALYADMGHLGRTPILKAWYFVFVALLLNYMGQGAFLIAHPEAKNVLFEMILAQSKSLYVPFLFLSILATVIASQAMISGMFSIVYQSITTRLMPMFKVDYTSTEFRSQIYIGFVNWFLLVSVLIIMYEFKASSNLAAAYGLAVTGTMSLTGLFMTWIFYLRKNWPLTLISFFVFLVDVVYFASNTFKIPHGGYWSIIIAAIPFIVIMIYTKGQRRLYMRLKPMPLRNFLPTYVEFFKRFSKIQGTGLFFARDMNMVPPYIVRTMFADNIIYEDNLIVSMEKIDEPFGVKAYTGSSITDGLRTFVIEMGYMEVVDVERLLLTNGIDIKTIFYGQEDIATNNFIWKIFSLIKKLTPSYVQFYKLPSHKLRGVIYRIDM
ncbi:MAG: KUP/HAK/KT family potassium transporter [Nitrospirae bacterium]|uniref:KUP/HAK/KT family potassium transporter n=1 Tax=Candidatus Magnetobacterium casense TaxID=1455061 RepID=UPI00058C954F|nr:KUP/HAK/KT family potassium transporter [Candidatus Magnetobacterium casensis]MBF0336327.1 KUP/HAK/KT family potassium transporter [Nitrospirota bacterium]